MHFFFSRRAVFPEMILMKCSRGPTSFQRLFNSHLESHDAKDVLRCRKNTNYLFNSTTKPSNSMIDNRIQILVGSVNLVWFWGRRRRWRNLTWRHYDRRDWLTRWGVKFCHLLCIFLFDFDPGCVLIRAATTGVNFIRKGRVLFSTFIRTMLPLKGKTLAEVSQLPSAFSDSVSMKGVCLFSIIGINHFLIVPSLQFSLDFFSSLPGFHSLVKGAMNSKDLGHCLSVSLTVY